MTTSLQSSPPEYSHGSAKRSLALLCVALLLVFVFSVFLGRYPQPGLISFSRIAEDQLAQRVVLNLRIPRVLTALLLGMSLSAAGMVFQMIFSNPLVEPGFLGVSNGAAFGAAFSILFLGNQAWLVQSSAAVFAFLGLGFTYLLARKVQFGGWVLRLVLAGIAVSAIFSAGVGLLKFAADPLSQLPEITFWMLGGLWRITWTQLRAVLPVVLIGLLVLYKMRWRLNLLSLEDEIAYSLGVSPAVERGLLLVASVAVTAAVVSVSGLVGWVGLIVPHLARRIFGADSRYSLPGSMLIGGILGIICDDLARTLLAGEIPLGILTSLIGAGMFIVLMSSRRMQVQR